RSATGSTTSTTTAPRSAPATATSPVVSPGPTGRTPTPTCRSRRRPTTSTSSWRAGAPTSRRCSPGGGPSAATPSLARSFRDHQRPSPEECHVRVYVPVPSTTAPVALDAALRESSILRVGVVDDNLDPPLIEGVVEQMQSLLPEASIRVWVKPVGTSPEPDSLIDEMAREVQVALAGVGM